jgi:S1-C subfamily serine protease
VATVDWIALAVVLLAAAGGWRRGLVASAFSLGGLVAGGYAGSRLAPHALHSGSGSQWTPFASLVGALAGAALLQLLGAVAGAFVRRSLKATPFRLADSAGGIVLGAATGLVLVWVLGATALLLPGQTRLRREAQSSAILRRLNEHVPPRRLLHLLARIDPLPSITGPPPPGRPPDAAIRHVDRVRRAERSVVRVVGTACGVGVEGSGWFIGPRTVVTAAHVVAGERDTHVELPGRPGTFAATVIGFNARNDVAILRVHGVQLTPLRVRRAPQPGRSVAIVGYPENGPLTATPGRVGETRTVLTRDLYGRGVVARTITAVAGEVRHGDSGGPAVDSDGYVQTMLFAARIGSSSPVGYGVPTPIVLDAARAAQRPVSTGDCAAG